MSDLQRLVDDVIMRGNELRVLHGFATPAELAAPRGPADPAALEAFARAFRGKVPPSYIELLAIHDGIDRFDWVDLTLHGVDFLTKHPDLDESWIEAEHFEPDEVFVFAWAETDASCIAFRRTKLDPSGEMAVVSFDAKGPIWQAPNLRAFLEMRRRWFEKSIDEALGDQGLPAKYKAAKKPAAKKPAAKRPAAKKPAAKRPAAKKPAAKKPAAKKLAKTGKRPTRVAASSHRRGPDRW